MGLCHEFASNHQEEFEDLGLSKQLTPTLWTKQSAEFIVRTWLFVNDLFLKNEMVEQKVAFTKYGFDGTPPASKALKDCGSPSRKVYDGYLDWWWHPIIPYDALSWDAYLQSLKLKMQPYTQGAR